MIEQQRNPRTLMRRYRPYQASHIDSVSISLVSSQPRDISTAFDHCLYIFALSSGEIFGVKVVRLARFMCFSSSNSFQMPTANPAAIAAPRAVVSCIDGRSTGIRMISA